MLNVRINIKSTLIVINRNAPDELYDGNWNLPGGEGGRKLLTPGDGGGESRNKEGWESSFISGEYGIIRIGDKPASVNHINFMYPYV